MNKLFQLLLVAALIIVSNSNTSEPKQPDLKKISGLMNKLGPLLALRKDTGEWAPNNWLHTGENPREFLKQLFKGAHNSQETYSWKNKEGIDVHSRASRLYGTWVSRNNPYIFVGYPENITVPENLSKRDQDTWKRVFRKSSGEIIGDGVVVETRLTAEEINALPAMKYTGTDPKLSQYYSPAEGTICRLRQNYNNYYQQTLTHSTCLYYDNQLEVLMKAPQKPLVSTNKVIENKMVENKIKDEPKITAETVWYSYIADKLDKNNTLNGIDINDARAKCNTKKIFDAVYDHKTKSSECLASIYALTQNIKKNNDAFGMGSRWMLGRVLTVSEDANSDYDKRISEPVNLDNFTKEQVKAICKMETEHFIAGAQDVLNKERGTNQNSELNIEYKHQNNYIFEKCADRKHRIIDGLWLPPYSQCQEALNMSLGVKKQFKKLKEDPTFKDIFNKK